VTLECLIVMI